ncbi:ccr4-not transcription complex [Culex quinquefasciatus]|uniref:Ccr4-not transcription complex n=1 Tax=Culex quinquefasciatus TaxID=7176 RepID=B0WX75_CULQU|nr:ccr4-not transcription complex [Culex quinquefasciatus]|eukprot:XP_001861997.1 ccr4-not transcription complex [Culex quinquefasciatus]
MWVQEDCRCVGAVNSNVYRMKLKLVDENQDFNLAVQGLYDGLQWQIKTAECKQSLRDVGEEAEGGPKASTILTCLQVCVGNVSPDLTEVIMGMSQYNLLVQQQQPPTGVLR